MRVLVLLHFSAFFRNFIESRAPGAGVNTQSIPIIFSSEPGQMALPGRRGAPVSHGRGINTWNSLLGNEIKQT